MVVMLYKVLGIISQIPIMGIGQAPLLHGEVEIVSIIEGVKYIQQCLMHLALLLLALY